MTPIPLAESPSSRLRVLPTARQMAHDAGYLALGLPIGVAAFSLAVTGLALAAGLAITLAGIPILLATLLIARAIGELERRRAAPALGSRIAGRELALDGTLWQRTKTIAADPASWRDTAWSLLLLPIGTAGFTAVVTLWSVALGMVTSPAWLWATNDGDPDLPFFNDLGAGYSVLRVITGLALIPIAAWGSRALASGTARLARAILG